MEKQHQHEHEREQHEFRMLQLRLMASRSLQAASESSGMMQSENPSSFGLMAELNAVLPSESSSSLTQYPI